MQRRYFEHLYNEISVAAGHRISRYDLWLQIWEAGGDPDELTSREVAAFVALNLTALLSEEGSALSPRERKRLENRILRFDPRYPTPEEWLASALPDGTPGA